MHQQLVYRTAAGDASREIPDNCLRSEQHPNGNFPSFIIIIIIAILATGHDRNARGRHWDITGHVALD